MWSKTYSTLFNTRKKTLITNLVALYCASQVFTAARTFIYTFYLATRAIFQMFSC